jgi:mannose-6-phosphate isomerase
MMTRLYPLTFHPLFKERVWGGRTLETLYRKRLPAGVPIGESWEISDRPGDESVIANGPLAGRSLRWLMEHHGREILGDAKPADEGRFPMLCKILDARDTLSLQVHPPARASNQLGEPKTEMWYVARAEPGASLYAGLKSGVTRETFEEELRRGTVADCVHRFPVRTGDTMFLPSGRVHAIGAGLVIFEIQQNSDTTFRVFDWNRVGLDGRPRDLHVAESLESIDFSDVEPSLAGGDEARSGEFQVRSLVRDALFNADLIHAETADVMALPPQPRIVALVDGAATVTGGSRSERLQPGQFCIVPASVADAGITADADSAFLLVEPGKASR